MYFKYRTRIVWDKRFRLDDVFGSQGGKHIEVVIAEYDAAHPRDDANGDNNNNANKSDDEQDHDGESDDEDADADDATAAPRGRPAGDANRPNYFLCFKVDDAKIQFAAQRVQESVVKFDSRLSQACLPSMALHVTLLTMRIASDQLLAAAKTALADFQAELCRLISPDRKVQFKRVAVFRDRVLYGQVAPQDAGLLNALVNRLRHAFEAAGIRLVGNHDHFTAHMTLVKLNRKLCREMHHIPQGAYMPSEHTHFGEQRIEAVHLCRMTADKDETGFYHRIATVYNAYPSITVEQYTAALAARTAHATDKRVLILRGLSGAGKTNLVEALAHQLDTEISICSADRFYGKDYVRTAQNIGEAHAFCLKSFHEALSAHQRLVVVDNTNAQLKEYEAYITAAEAAGYVVEIVEMQCVSHAQAQQIALRNRHQVPLDACLAMFDRWQADPRATYIAAWMPADTSNATDATVKKTDVAKTQPVLYTAIFFTQEARDALLTAVPPRFNRVFADHVTLLYRPQPEQVDALPFGAAIKVQVISAVHDDQGQCVSVKILSDLVSSANAVYVSAIIMLSFDSCTIFTAPT